MRDFFATPHAFDGWGNVIPGRMVNGRFEPYPPAPGPQGNAVQHAAEVHRREAYANVQAWAESTAPVTFARDWWCAVARPAVAAQPRWEVFVEENRPGVPEFNGGGEFVGSVGGATPPAEETVAAMVAEWENSGE